MTTHRLPVGLAGVLAVVLSSVAQAAPEPISKAQAQAIDAGSLLRDTEAAARLAGGLVVQADHPTARDGQPLVFTIDVPRSGYLNVVSINASGEPTVLFPNRLHPGNRVAAGRFTLPDAQMAFQVRATAPFGRTTVAAFLTQDPLDLTTDHPPLGAASATKSAGEGGILAQLSSAGRDLLDALGTRSLAAGAAAVSSPSPTLGGLTTVLTCASHGPCDVDAIDPASRVLQVLGALAPGILSEPEPEPEAGPEPKSPSVPAPVRGLSDKGLLLTKVSEGFVPQLYEDAAHFCSIAYGHLLHQSRCASADRRAYPKRLPEPTGALLLAQDMARAERAVMQMVTVKLTDGQYAALCDFTYNVGSGNLKRSTLLKVVNAGNAGRVPTQLRRWTQAGGITLRGLKTRREREIVLYFDGGAVPKSLVEDPDTAPVDVEAGESGN